MVNFYFHSTVVRKHNFSHFNLFVKCSSILCVLETVPCVPEKSVYDAIVAWSILYMSVRSSCYIVFKSSPLFIFDLVLSNLFFFHITAHLLKHYCLGLFTVWYSHYNVTSMAAGFFVFIQRYILHA